MDTLEERCIEAIRDGHGYDYIANNYHLFSMEQLKRIALECLYEIGENDDRTTMQLNIAGELEDTWRDYEE